MKNVIVTPEIIFKEFSKRLKKKEDDLEYLMHVEKGFEKWLQYELILTMSESYNYRPRVYDNNFKEVTDDKERIYDIAAEYPIGGYNKNLRSDVIIAKRPFLSEFSDDLYWQILENKFITECKDKFNSIKYHYIELKCKIWVGIDRANIISNIIIGDLKKYINKSFKDNYNPCSAISICCVSFWKPEAMQDLSKLEINKAIKKIRVNVCRKFNNLYHRRLNFNYEKVSDYTYLLMAYYKL